MEEKLVPITAVIVSLFVVYVISGTIAWCFLKFEYKYLFKWMVFRIGYRRPKKIFYECQGSLYLMSMRRLLDKYKSYHIPAFIEKKWLLDMKEKFEKKILTSEDKNKVIESARAYYNVTGRLNGVEGASFLREYITKNEEAYPTNLLRELLDVFIFMTVYMIRDELDIRKDNLLWALELLRKMIKGEITFSHEAENIYVIETENGKRYVKEWWLEGARLYSAEDERDALRYLINVCKGSLGELMYYGSGFSNNDIADE
ncbi:MAG: hypothetical protein IKU60_00730 [Clostridia bacterium]|nr:hypothetical protein [Clostridia bacterium]